MLDGSIDRSIVSGSEREIGPCQLTASTCGESAEEARAQPISLSRRIDRTHARSISIERMGRALFEREMGRTFRGRIPGACDPNRRHAGGRISRSRPAALAYGIRIRSAAAGARRVGRSRWSPGPTTARPGPPGERDPRPAGISWR